MWRDKKYSAVKLKALLLMIKTNFPHINPQVAVSVKSLERVWRQQKVQGVTQSFRDSTPNILNKTATMPVFSRGSDFIIV